MNNDILEHNETKPIDPEIAKVDEIKQQHNFYTIKHKDGEYQGITIKKAKIVDKLKEYSFFRFDIDAETWRFVHIQDNKVREVPKEQLIDKFFEHVANLKPYNHEVIFYKGKGKERKEVKTFIEIKAPRIREVLFEKLSEYFSKVLLYRLVPDKPIKIKKDTEHEKFFYYKNGFVKVTKGNFDLLNYKELDLNIWENQKLNRNFKIDTAKGDFEKFIERICGHKTKEAITPEVKKRILVLKTIIGYNLHGFFDCERFALIITDSRLSEDGEANGRSGKTLLAKSCGQMLNYTNDDDPLVNSQVFCEINGKNFKPTDKHRYSDARIETQFVAINDLNKNTDFETFLNDVTEGIAVDKKNEKPFRVHTKMMILTNKTLKIEGDSAKGRVKQFEVSDYFTADYNPEMELGRRMFVKSWPQEEWNRFDTFMIDCVVQYFKHGLLEAPSITLHRRTLIDHTTIEFVDFIDDFIKSGELKLINNTAALFDTSVLNLEYGNKIDKKMLFNAFCEQYPSDTKKLSQSKFTKYLRAYAKHTKTLQEISKTNKTEGRSNNVDWIIFNKIETSNHEQ